jgi:hypothetical protein
VRAAETLAPGAVLDFIRPNGRICDWLTGLARGRDPDIDTLAEAVICDGVRTPIGRYGGALSHVRTDDLAAIPIRALLDRNPSLPPERIDEVLLGDANQAGEDNRNVARMAALLAGLPVTVPGVTLNRLCASGMDAVGFAARGIRAGDYSIAIAGGVESMTRAPFVMPKPGAAWSRQAEVHDTTIGWRFVNPAMATAYGTDSMPQTADNVAADFGISRADQDAFALRSQERWAGPMPRACSREEIVPVTIPRRKGDPLVVDRDEHPAPGHHGRGAGEAARHQRPGADRDGRQCLGRQRRCGGASDREPGGGGGAWADPRRAHPRHGIRRGGTPRHGHRTGRSDAQAARPARAHHRRRWM